jgi:hypothetical protein
MTLVESQHAASRVLESHFILKHMFRRLPDNSGRGGGGGGGLNSVLLYDYCSLCLFSCEVAVMDSLGNVVSSVPIPYSFLLTSWRLKVHKHEIIFNFFLT